MEFAVEMNDVCDSESDKTNVIIDIEYKSISESTTSDDGILSREASSMLELENNADDVCGPWKFHSAPLLHSQCGHLSFKLITTEDVAYMRKQEDQKPVLLFLDEKILSDLSYKEKNKEILVKLLWQTFKFFKKNLFTDEQIARIMKLILLTHNFYTANYWNTAEEAYKYFFERVLECTVMDPPKCAEIFTPNQGGIILEFFRKVYLENIVLLHLVCTTHYCIVMRLDDRNE